MAEGFAGFTLQAVARRTGIQYGNLTHHYATRDALLEAMFDSLAERYRERFQLLVARAGDGQASVRDVITWLVDDAVGEETAPVFLQLWAMASHLPWVADGMARLYDHAVDAFIEAYGLDPHAASAKGLRDALYLLGTILEGSSCIFWTRDHSGKAFRESVRDLAVETIADLVERRLAEARKGHSRPAPAKTVAGRNKRQPRS